MKKIDFKKTLDSYKAKSGQFRIVNVPEHRYLMVDGRGAPGETEYLEAVEALYPVAYGIKFTSKVELERDYVVPPLEGLWWAEDMSAFTTNRDKSHWLWTMMIMLPGWIDEDPFEQAIAKVSKKKDPPPALSRVRCEALHEGTCVQTLHLGSFEDEGPVLETMHEEFIPDNGLEMTGKHHEIYFSDPRKTAPDKLRTILRQPVRKLA